MFQRCTSFEYSMVKRVSTKTSSGKAEHHMKHRGFWVKWKYTRRYPYKSRIWTCVWLVETTGSPRRAQRWDTGARKEFALAAISGICFAKRAKLPSLRQLSSRQGFAVSLGGSRLCSQENKKSTTRVLFLFWWKQLDSNQWPLACQASTLTNWAMPPNASIQ